MIISAATAGGQVTNLAPSTPATTGTGSSSSASSSSSSTQAATSSESIFMNLLIPEMKTQDPTAPMDPTQMVGQMLNMNELNQLIQINQFLQGSTLNPANSGSGATQPAAAGGH